jgi:hypothetical protein
VAVPGRIPNGVTCERGEDPVPCAAFSIDLPRSGTLILQMDRETPRPVFMYMYRRVNGTVVDLLNVDADQPSLIARQIVDGGTVYLDAGFYLPWANEDGSLRFRLLATLE